MLNRLNDYCQNALDGEIVLTKFLDLAEINQIKSLEKQGLKVYLNGGYENFERARALVMLSYYEEPSFEEFKIEIYHATFNKDFKDISHRNVLGSIMSLGIERNTIGDIYIFENNIYIFVSSEISKFLLQNMPSINNQHLTFEKVDEICEFHKMKEEFITINVQTPRLDSIIARSLKISREKASEMIETGYVSINHIECTNVSKKCQIGEIISIRKFGRLSIYEFVKTTKKDRLVLKVGVKH